MFHLFDSPGPFENPLGFGASDWLELTIAALLLLFIFGSPTLERLARRIAGRTTWCMLALAALPVILRLAVLPNHPVPTPDLYDEFTHLLTADTLRHFRFANPPLAWPQFFETFFVLQQPSYSSIYPIGQGVALAIGWMLFTLPWAGVVLSMALFSALCYWMLRGWTTPLWSLIGGLLAVVEFGPLNSWMNNYWGGGVSAIAGCLVFGALPRLRESARFRDAAVLGVGLGISLLTRPFESIFLFASVLLFFAPRWRAARSPSVLRSAALVCGMVAAAFALTLVQNKQVTGSWTTLPEMASQYQYGVPTTFTFLPNPAPHRDLTPQQQMQYKLQTSFHPKGTDTLETYFTRLEYRVRYYRFFFLAPLYLVLIAFLFTLRQSDSLWIAITLAMFALGTNFYPFFFPHYIAALTCLFILAAIVGLRRLAHLRIRDWPVGREAALIVLVLCAGQFIFWYTMHIFDQQQFSLAMRRYETWDALNHHYPARRISVNDQLAQMPGKLLVLVRYWPAHIIQDEWVYNRADLNAARIVWARDLGSQANETLRKTMPDRAAWLLEPDAQPPKLTQYVPEPPSTLHFEEVR